MNRLQAVRVITQNSKQRGKIMEITLERLMDALEKKERLTDDEHEMFQRLAMKCDPNGGR